MVGSVSGSGKFDRIREKGPDPQHCLLDKKILSADDKIWSAASREAGRHRGKTLQGADRPGLFAHIVNKF